MAAMATPWIIGASEYSSALYDPFIGQLDEFSIRAAMPSQAQITTHYNNMMQTGTFFSSVTAQTTSSSGGTTRQVSVIGSSIIRGYR